MAWAAASHAFRPAGVGKHLPQNIGVKRRDTKVAFALANISSTTIGLTPPPGFLRDTSGAPQKYFAIDGDTFPHKDIVSFDSIVTAATGH